MHHPYGCALDLKLADTQIRPTYSSPDRTMEVFVREAKEAINVVISVYTTKLTLVRVYLDPRQASTTLNLQQVENQKTSWRQSKQIQKSKQTNGPKRAKLSRKI